MAESRRIKAATTPTELTQQSKRILVANVQVKNHPVEIKAQPPDLQRRINARWLRLWRKVYPDTPPPTEVQSPKSKVQSPTTEGQGSASKGRRSSERRPAAVGYLSRFLCAGFAAALIATGCAGPRPLKGGRAVTTHKPAGVIEQTLIQGENASQATKQDQESIKVRTYTLPAGSTLSEECGVRSAEGRKAQAVNANAGQPSTIHPPPLCYGGRVNSQPINSQRPATINSETLSTFTLAAPMPVVEREETRARTELGAAQKDTAREIGAKLSSLKGIVWVGVGLFMFGLASLVYPPLKVIIGSVTTSAAVMAGGLCLMVLPSLIVGNELLILGGVAVAVGGWFLAHRHGQLSGIVAATNAGADPKAKG
jgi:hypothetical protein